MVGCFHFSIKFVETNNHYTTGYEKINANLGAGRNLHIGVFF